MPSVTQSPDTLDPQRVPPPIANTTNSTITTTDSVTLTPTDISSSRPKDRNLYDLVNRLRSNSTEIPQPIRFEHLDNDEGHIRTFNVVDIPSRQFHTVTATLHISAENADWYVDNTLSFQQNNLKSASRAFEEHIYPTLTDIFGTELPIRVAANQKITILNTSLGGVDGYFSGVDRYPTEVHPHSNEQEMVYLDAKRTTIGSEKYMGTLAHESMHVIQSRIDDTEHSWVNEGLAELGRILVGFPSAFLTKFPTNPTVSLVNWPLTLGNSSQYYDVATHFMLYLSQTFGDETLYAFMEEPLDGIIGIEQYLDSMNSGKSFGEIFTEWLVTRYLNEHGGETTSRIRPIPLTLGEVVAGSIPQYSGTFYEIPETSADHMRLSFKGQLTTPSLPTAPQTGNYCWWSNRGDLIDSMLTGTFKLEAQSHPKLSYSIWHEIENGWDFAYVQISTDEGLTWHILESQNMSDGGPQNMFGSTYTGNSNGWLRETIDLSEYAGHDVLLRFEYITDESIHGSGLCLDDITVEGGEHGNQLEGAEYTNSTWIPRGFVRLPSELPQDYTITVIDTDLPHANYSVPITPNKSASHVLHTNKGIVLVTALMNVTMQPATFELMVSEG
ncbi:MAG: hypothetical protein VX800_01040 [Chloroflexota bacterium]|nr:hypothetical protein [Chloroflexota bacterium]